MQEVIDHVALLLHVSHTKNINTVFVIECTIVQIDELRGMKY